VGHRGSCLPPRLLRLLPRAPARRIGRRSRGSCNPRQRALPLRALALFLAAALPACSSCADGIDAAKDDAAKERKAKLEEPCTEQAFLLSTSSGSPSSAACPNRLHRLRAGEVRTSDDEAAVLVTCTCPGAANPDAGPGG